MVAAHRKEPPFPYVDLSGANDEDLIVHWLSNARPGDWMCYHRGKPLALSPNSNRGQRLLMLAGTIVDLMTGRRGAGVLCLAQFKIEGGRAQTATTTAKAGNYMYLACRCYPEIRGQR